MLTSHEWCCTLERRTGKKIMYMQILIEALTKLRDVVLDLYASTYDIHSHSH